MAEHFPCAFHLALITGENGCAHATPITRRGGPDIGCASESAHQRCAILFNYIRQAAQAELGFSDDLTQAPHSVKVKLQNGGLRGLNQVLGNTGAVTDIAALMGQLLARYGDLAAIPLPVVVAAVSAHKLAGRGRKPGT